MRAVSLVVWLMLISPAMAQPAPGNQSQGSVPDANRRQPPPNAGWALRFQGSNPIGAKLVPELTREYARRLGFTSELLKPTSDPDVFSAEYAKAESEDHVSFQFEARGSATA